MAVMETQQGAYPVCVRVGGWWWGELVYVNKNNVKSTISVYLSYTFNNNQRTGPFISPHGMH